MKKILLGFAFYAALAVPTMSLDRTGVAQAQPDNAQVSFGFFYSSLSPYGEWVRIDGGYDAWRPYRVSRGWRPYLDGRWVWTSYGWYWMSYEPYGWAVFHYGRWYYDDYYGWVWVPGYEWGPAWVEWRYNDDYVGWAPLPPYATFSVSVGIRFTRVWVAPTYYWTFVGCRNFTSVRIVDHALSVERTRRFFGSTRGSVRYEYDNGRVVNRGIETGFIERRTGNRVERVDVAETRDRGSERIVRDGNRERLEIYRPRKEDIERVPEGRGRRDEGRPSVDQGRRGSRGPELRRPAEKRPEKKRDGYRMPERPGNEPRMQKEGTRSGERQRPSGNRRDGGRR